MIGHRQVDDAIERTKGVLTIRGVLDLSPHSQEDVGNEIVGRVDVAPSPAIGVHMPVVALIHRGEYGRFPLVVLGVTFHNRKHFWHVQLGVGVRGEKSQDPGL